jgi:transposase
VIVLGWIKLEKWQRYELRRQLKETVDVRLYRRTLAVLELDRGRSVAEVADMLGVTRQSVYNWALSHARDTAPVAAMNRARKGRPRLLVDGLEDLLRSLMACSPRDLGFKAKNWTVHLLQDELERNTGLRPSDDTVQRGLWRLGYVWKRTSYVRARADSIETVSARLVDDSEQPPPGDRRRRDRDDSERSLAIERYAVAARKARAEYPANARRVQDELEEDEGIIAGPSRTANR